MTLRVGTAGWSIAGSYGERFPASGTGLERYAARLDCAEINSCFYRPHRPATYERWAAAVPDDFRFSAKLPKAITHGARLVGSEALQDAFVAETIGLGAKLGIILVQLPPSLTFDADIAGRFFTSLQDRTPAGIVCEPRHPSWFRPDADALLADRRVARVAADPALVENATPGGWRELSYYRLHGSPVIYRSGYDDGRLETLAARVAAERLAGKAVWCVFDNTASSAAIGDALKLSELVAR